MRTFVYHELLISYLDYVRCKGYNTAHIWACPPLKGDDYILFAKPEDQKIPKDDRLRQWYIDMLKDSQRRGIVGKMTNAYDLYFASGKNDATILPYMEGDYFPAEMENIIKDMDEGKNLSKAPVKASKKGKKEKKKKAKAGARGGTRSSGIDKELLSASGIVPEGMDVKSLKEGGSDWVMKKLGETIHPMRESFLVAYLAREDQTAENLVVPKDIMEYREKHGIPDRAPCSLETIKEEDKMDVDEENSKPAASGEESTKKEGDNTTEEEVKKEDDDNKKDESEKKDNEAKPEGDAKEEEKKEDEVKKEDGESSKDEDGDEKMKDDTAAEAKADHTPIKEEPVDEEVADADKSESADANKEESKDGEKKDDDAAAMDVESPDKEDEKKDDSSDKKDDEPTDEKGDKSEDDDPKKPADDEESPKDGDGESTKESESTDEIKKEDSAEETSIKQEPTDENEATSDDKKDTNGKSDDDKTKTDNGETSEEKKEEEAADDKAKSDDTAKSDEDAVEKDSAEPVKVKEEEKNEEDNDGEKTTDATTDGKTDDKTTDKEAPSTPGDRSGKFAAMSKKKGDDESTPKPDDAKSGKTPDDAKSDKKPDEQSSKNLIKDSKGRLVKVIDDDEEEMDCEFLNNRQLFLNLCQGNHYQFDSLRRAKHTSMMVLWHLHNRDAPKFVQQCAICAREILQGKRYHCPTCADFDQCIDCLRNPQVARHPHPLQAIPVGSTQSTLTAEQRKERQRSIALHMTLLLHASTCRSTKCNSANCAKMKGLLKHGAGCKVKANGGCNVCKRIWALLQIHARQCKTENCPVPNCMAIRKVRVCISLSFRVCSI